MNPTVTASESGLVVYNNGHKILLDPRRESLADVMFFSHAHTDHLIPTTRRKTLYSKKVLASKATSYLAQVRGTDLAPADCQECSDGYDLIDTCHVLGSKGLLIDDQIYYTADISTRKRGFMGSARIPRVDSLIVESTFGLGKDKKLGTPPMATPLGSSNLTFTHAARESACQRSRTWPKNASPAFRRF